MNTFGLFLFGLFLAAIILYICYRAHNEAFIVSPLREEEDQKIWQFPIMGGAYNWRRRQ